MVNYFCDVKTHRREDSRHIYHLLPSQTNAVVLEAVASAKLYQKVFSGTIFDKVA